MEIIKSIRGGCLVRHFMPVFGLVAVMMTSGWKPLQDQLPEFQVKAVFLYNFTQFVYWPDSAFQDEESPFVIGVLGENPFQSFLEETLAGETINNRSFIIREFDHAEEVGDCHLLYISESDKDKVKKVLNKLQGKHTLTIGDIPGFSKIGGMIEFSEKENRVGFRINQDRVQQAELTVSSKLLRLAEVVFSENENHP